jgi:hypothetical protein
LKSEPRPPKQKLQSSPLDVSGGKEPSTAEDSLNEIRNRLQSFGYLNSRIERFYLSSFSQTASLFLNRFLLSLRVGVLTGTLAALLMTGGTVLLNEQLLRHQTDVALLFLYFEVFFVLLFAGMELVFMYAVSLFISIWGGRTVVYTGQTVSFLIGIAFFAYFFYWGQSQIDYLRLLPPIYSAALVLLLIVACTFVAKCSWLGFLVAFREADLGNISPNLRKYGWGVVVLLAGIALFLIFFGGNQNREIEDQPPLAVVTTPDRWVVIGIDGLPADVLRRFIQSGDLPYFRSLISSFPIAPLEVNEPVVPPVSWTTIATGVTPAEHGIRTSEMRRWRGLSSWFQITPFQLAIRSIAADTRIAQRQPVSGYVRKVKTFWEILSDSRIRTGVVNWWGSWPARPIFGWNVSERYFYKRIAGGKPEEETFPPDLFLKFSPPRKKEISGENLDRFYMGIYQQEIRTDPVRLAALYLPGLDILNHEFYEKRALDPFAYTEEYRNHLRWLDDQLRTIDSESKESQIMIIFYQGRSFRGRRSGILIRHNRIGLPETLRFAEGDITPLILYSCGLPVSRSMKLDLLHALYSPEALAKNPIRYANLYRKSEQMQPSDIDEFDDLLVEQMKSLGYLQ